MWPAVYKHWNSRTERDAINTASSDLEWPGPRWPQPHLTRGLRGGNTQCTGPRVKSNVTPRERAGRTYCESGWLRPCVRRPSRYVTEFDSWRTRRGPRDSPEPTTVPHRGATGGALPPINTLHELRPRVRRPATRGLLSAPSRTSPPRCASNHARRRRRFTLLHGILI